MFFKQERPEMDDFEEEEKNQNNKKLGCKGKILALQSTPPPLSGRVC